MCNKNERFCYTTSPLHKILGNEGRVSSPRAPALSSLLYWGRAAETSFDAAGESYLPRQGERASYPLQRNPGERKVGFSAHAPRNCKVVQRREGLWLHLPTRW